MPHKILFVSEGNAVRSQMAEALLNQMSGERYRACSAGVEPSDIDERTVNALQSMKVPAEGLHSKPLQAFDAQEFDEIIVLCDKSKPECKSFPHFNKAMIWNFKDPRNDDRRNAFAKTLQEIQQRLQMFVLIKDKDLH